MAAVLEMPKSGNKQEEFVEKQIETARQRIRLLDWVATGLILASGSLAFLFAVLLIDHYVETAAGAGWLALAIYLLAGGGFVYWSLYRPSRRQINPFYAARQVEQTIPDAKNSVINFVDLNDDEKIPGSVRTAIGARAAKDLKHVNLNEAIQKRQVKWLAGLAGLFFIAAVVAFFLPPTRTTLKLVNPENGSTTITQGQDFHLEVKVFGRIPKKTDPDALRVRIWYNPEDPGTYEEPLLEQVEGKKDEFALVVPARQVRGGFHYKVLAGNAQTADFEVKVNIIPAFTGWKVEYVYPSYLNREPSKSEDPNLVGYFNTQVTITAYTNRPVKSGSLRMPGRAEIAGQVPDDNPEAIVFTFPMVRSGNYSIRFVTTDDRPNPDPPQFRIALLDPQPLFLNYDVTFDYPKYLRAQPVTITLRDAHLEALRGTEVTLNAYANRAIRSAKIEFPGQGQPIKGIVDSKRPMQATFKLPPLMQDGSYRVVFQPDSNEAESRPRVFNIRALADEKPIAIIDQPEHELIYLPANGMLVVEGRISDDYGIDSVKLHMRVVSPGPPLPLAPKSYRNGKSFRRDTDGSYPTELAYKDFVELSTLKATGQNGAAFQVKPDMVIEYWLEAIDNCEVPPGPNSGLSRAQRFKIIAPENKPDQQKQQQADKQNAQRDQQQHEQKQDQQNAGEKRDPKQPQPKGDQPQQQQPKNGRDGEPQKNDGNPPVPSDMPDQGMADPMAGGNPPPMNDEELRKQEKQVRDALAKADPKNGMGAESDPTAKPPELRPDQPTKDNPKTDPALKDQPTKENPKNPEPTMGEPKSPPEKNNKNPVPTVEPKPDPTKTEPKAEPKKSEAEPKKGMDPDENPDPKDLPRAEDLQKLADDLKSDDPKKQEQARQTLKQMMDQAKKNPPDREEQRKQLEDHRNKLDEQKKEDFDQALKDLQKEMQDLKREERVQKAAEKAMSNDQQTREQGQKELEKEMQNSETRDKTERQLQHLAGDQADSTKRKRLEDATEKAENLTRNKPKPQPSDPSDPTPPAPKKKEEENVDKLAKKMQKGNEEEKKEAKDELEKMMKKDKPTEDRVQKQLDDIRNNIKDEQERKNFDQSMRKIKDDLKKDQETKQAVENVEKFADKLTSDDKQEREAAQKQLEEAMKKADQDPKSSEQAQKKLDDVRNNIKDEQKKKDFDQAMQKIDKAVQEQREEQRAKAEQEMKKEAEKLASDLTSKDPDKQKAAQQKLEDALKDPQKRDAIKKEMDKIKEKSDDAQTKEKLDDAVKQAQANADKKDPSTGEGKDKVDPKEIEKIAKDLNSKDEGTKQAAQEKLEEKLNDPKTRDAVKKELDNIKGKGDEQTKDNIDKAVKQAEERNQAKNDPKGPQPSAEDIQKFAEKLTSDNKQERDAAQKLFEEAMKKADENPKAREDAQKKLDEVRNGIKDEQKKKDFDQAMQKIDKAVQEHRQEQQAKAEQQMKKDADQIAKDLNSKEPGKAEAAQEKLEKMLQDPKTRDAVKKELEDLKKKSDGQTKDNIAKALEKAEKDLAEKDGKKGGALDPKDVEKLVKQMQSKDPADQKEAEKKLEEILNDPKKKADFEKQVAEMMKDPEKRKEIQKATEQIIKNQIDKLADNLQDGTPEEKRQAEQKLDELLKNPLSRDMVKKQLEEHLRNMKDEQARKDLEKKLKDLEDKIAKAKKEGDEDGKKTGDLTKHDGKKAGNNPTEEAPPGSLPDLKNKAKSHELTLEQFKKNITNEEFRKEVKLSDKQLEDFRKKYEQELADLQKQIAAKEKGELPPPRVVKGASPLDSAERIKSDDKKDAGNLNGGGRYIPPPGFGDPYSRFRDDIGGIRTPAPQPKK